MEFEQRLQTKLKMPSDARHALLKFFRRESILVERRNLSDMQCRDPHDIPILEAAVGGNSDYLVTGDKDLLVLKKIARIPICSPRQLYQTMMTE